MDRPGRLRGRRRDRVQVMSAPIGWDGLEEEEREAAVWCALCPAWASDQAALDQHQIEKHPNTGLSTSARLRRVEEERDELKGALAATRTDLKFARHDSEHVAQERDAAQAELASARTELEQLRAELVRANAWPAWNVARQTGPACTACRQPIRRGEAYTRAVVADELAHVHCPNPEGATP